MGPCYRGTKTPRIAVARYRRRIFVKDKSNSSPTAVGTTNSGPSHPGAPATEMARHGAEQEALVESMPFNANKPGEYGLSGALAPEQGASSDPPSPQTG